MFSMKRFTVAALAFSLMLLAGCGATPTAGTQDLAVQSQQITDAVNNATVATAALKAELLATKAQVAASGASTAPVDKAIAQVEKIPVAVAKAAPVVNAVNNSIQTAATQGATPTETMLSAAGAGATAAAPIAGPSAGYVALAGLGLTLLSTILQQIRVNNANKASQKNIDAVQAGIASGQITVPNPASASKAVDAVVADHPAGDRLVDVIAGK